MEEESPTNDVNYEVSSVNADTHQPPVATVVNGQTGQNRQNSQNITNSANNRNMDGAELSNTNHEITNGTDQRPQNPPQPGMNGFDGGEGGVVYNNVHKSMPWDGKDVTLEQIQQIECFAGSERGLMPCADIVSTSDVLLEIDGIPVAGCTAAEIQQIVAKQPEHEVRMIEGGNNFPVALRDFLSRRFLPSTNDRTLQEIVRSNVYNNTVPYTTREPHDGEASGGEYHFVSTEQFLDMEKSEELIESGVYCGNYYGTVRPAPDACNNVFQDKPKVRRRDSFVAAIDASMLPYGWERIADAQYGVYYIDHLHKKTQYERPYEVELTKSASGFGFTLVEIDNGHLMLKSLIEGSPAHMCGVIHTGDVLISVSDRTLFGLTKEDIGVFFSQYKVGEKATMTFARGFPIPNDFLAKEYQDLWLDIVKGDTGFGFTICQSVDGQTVSGVNNRDRCQGLEIDDLLVSVNNIDLHDYSHMEVAEILSECSVGKPTRFVIRRKRKTTFDTPLESQESSLKAEFFQPPKQQITTVSNIEKPVSCSSDMSYGPYRSEEFEMNNLDMKDTMPYIPGLMVDPDMMYEFLEVILTRDESGFGIRIGGGKEEGTNIFVNLVIQNTAAYFDGRLRAGDEIIKLNDEFVVGSTHEDFVKRMAAIGRSIKLLVRRRHFKFAFDVVLERTNQEGFGFVIISCGNCALIGRIIEHSPAWRSEKLNIRDRIVAVNGTDVTLFSHTDIVKMIKNSGQRLCLKIVPTDLYTVELVRGPNGFGFSLRGGAEYDQTPLSVSDIQKFGPADEGGLSPNDEILGINGTSTHEMTRSWALNLISQYPAVKLFMRKSANKQFAPQAPMSNYEQYGVTMQTGAPPPLQQMHPSYQIYGSTLPQQELLSQMQPHNGIYSTDNEMQFLDRTPKAL